ncbi:MAG: hypothetical protein MUE73_16210 [Planctomycetes bacterium]|jgi:hypothetical protein|nr:hypothetical protein [Planctomycetota bacterium]
MSAPLGVTLEFPGQALTGSRVPFKVTMTADMTTYHAVNGILDRALEVVLVRRDRPGIRLLAKVDPHAILLEEEPLPPAPPPDSPEAKVRVTEVRNLDLTDYGATHYGGAAYHVFATFGPWLTEIRPLAIEDRSRSLPWGDVLPAPPLPDDVEQPLPAVPPARGLVAAVVRREGLRVEGAMRSPVVPSRFRDEPPPAPFVTLVALHRRPEGGVSGGSFLLPVREEGKDHVAQFSIPLAKIAPRPVLGTCRILVFSGDLPPVAREFLWAKGA